jgi:hypothetical protein
LSQFNSRGYLLIRRKPTLCKFLPLMRLKKDIFQFTLQSNCFLRNLCDNLYIYAIINLTTQHYIPVIQLFDEAIHCYTIHNTLTLTYPPPKKNTLKSNHTTSICVTETISSAYLVRFISFQHRSGTICFTNSIIVKFSRYNILLILIGRFCHFCTIL